MAAGRRSQTEIVTPDGKLPFGGVDRGPIVIPHQRDGDTTQIVWMLPFHWLAHPYAQRKILTAELPLTLYPGASLGRLRILPGACQDVRRGTQVPEGALGAGEQFHLPRAPAATVAAHSIEDGTDRHVALRHVGLVDHAVLPAAVAGDAHEPRRERPERRGLLRRSAAGVAVAAPVPPESSGERLFKKSQRRSEWTHFAAASFAPCSTLSELAMRQDAEPDWGAVLKTKTMLRRGRSATRRLTMRKAIFATLAVLGLSLATTALAPTANASKTYLYQANQNNDGG